MNPRAILGLVVAVLGIASVYFSKLAIPMMMAGIIVFLVQRKEARAPRIALMVAAPFILVGLVRFTVVEAMPGIIEAGREALTVRAIAAMREVRFTQDVLREQATWDPDGDGIGSAGLIAELGARVKLRGAVDVPQGLLQRFSVYEDGHRGTFAVHAGYGIVVFLPTSDGQATAFSGVGVDDERAERRYLAYAWPMTKGHGEHMVVYLDEHERIWVSDNTAPDQGYAGKDRMPDWDAALPSSLVDEVPSGLEVRGQDGGLWRPWKKKEARKELPGDKS